MISAQPNKPQQEKLIARLMDLPNNAVSNITYKFTMFNSNSVGLSHGSSIPEP